MTNKELPIGTPVIANLFASRRIGRVTAHISEDIILIDGKQTFISDVQYNLNKNNPLKPKLIGMEYSDEEKEKINSLINN